MEETAKKMNKAGSRLILWATYLLTFFVAYLIKNVIQKAVEDGIENTKEAKKA